jgi:hypothetical protein
MGQTRVTESHRTPSPVAQPVSGPPVTAVVQSKPPAAATDVALGIVFAAVAGSNEPPPVSRTSLPGNPPTLPLKPKPLRPPTLNPP